MTDSSFPGLVPLLPFVMMKPFSRSIELCLCDSGYFDRVADSGSEVDVDLESFECSGDNALSWAVTVFMDGVTTRTKTMRSAGAQAQSCEM
jgi:hypothetical protein